MPDLLDTSALLGNIPNLLPTSSTSLSSSQDALAVLLHAAMTALSFRLVATDESATAQEPLGTTPGQLPEGWNNKGPDVYTFKYKHDQSSFTFLLKLVKLSGRVIVHGIALEVGDCRKCYLKRLLKAMNRTTKPRILKLILRTTSRPRSSRTTPSPPTVHSYTDTSPHHALQILSVSSRPRSFSLSSQDFKKKGTKKGTYPVHHAFTHSSRLSTAHQAHLPLPQDKVDHPFEIPLRPG